MAIGGKFRVGKADFAAALAGACAGAMAAALGIPVHFGQQGLSGPGAVAVAVAAGAVAMIILWRALRPFLPGSPLRRD